MLLFPLDIYLDDMRLNPTTFNVILARMYFPKKWTVYNESLKTTFVLDNAQYKVTCERGNDLPGVQSQNKCPKTEWPQRSLEYFRCA